MGDNDAEEPRQGANGKFTAIDNITNIGASSTGLQSSDPTVSRGQTDTAEGPSINNIKASNKENVDTKPMVDFTQVSPSAETLRASRRKSTIEPHEAVRRGLSFGPIRKPGSKQPSTFGILKPKSKSQSPHARLAQRSPSSSSDILSTTGVGRLKKDSYANDTDEEGAAESSDDDLAESSGDETSVSGGARGRKGDTEGDQCTIPESPLPGPGDGPTLTLTKPDGHSLKQSSAKRFVVHPNTNFDQRVSRPASPNTSDSEELNDIRRAQRLHINSSPIDNSVPHRVIQTIIRGDFVKMQEEATEGIRRLRTYLVATDLSGEAAYALEWTIGTVLRDGDTLMAVYAVDEEIGTGIVGDSLPIGEGGKAMQDTTAVMERMTVASQKGSSILLPAPLSKAAFRSGSRKSSAANSTDSRALSKAEQERYHAIEKLSETCLRFLRKTKLQVRIAIEVIHCKSPKYMVTEAVSLGSFQRRIPDTDTVTD